MAVDFEFFSFFCSFKFEFDSIARLRSLTSDNDDDDDIKINDHSIEQQQKRNIHTK